MQVFHNTDKRIAKEEKKENGTTKENGISEAACS
jgi:hypothetical protein